MNDISSIIKNLSADKAHEWDDISIRMIQLCGIEIILPLQLLFKSMLEEGIFLEDWKKSNVVPVYKKESKYLIKNCQPISLIPIFSKIFERVIVNFLFNYFMQNKLFTKFQSEFIPADPCVAQVVSITHEIYKSFDFFSIKLFNLHYTNEQRAYNVKIKIIYKKITIHALNLMNYFKSHNFVKITINTK